ncbi:amidohydrolase family protein [Hyalangium gracile]|uniref:hypothetical protein n=1 Tax=Hyalangium gracile TaxID=394092 RepID=UPI001CCA8FBB|nr:hypothetical protein [Hyalangium gracile]
MSGAGQGQLGLGTLTPRRVPEAYIRAEVASFPLTHLKAFQTSLTVLDPQLDGRMSHSQPHPTRELWRECEKSLSEHASGWSLDRLIAVRDHFWFIPPGDADERQPLRGVPLHRYLRRLALTHLERRPGVTEVAQRSDIEAVDALTHYRWLTFALPEDLLLAAMPVSPPATRVNIEPPLLVRRLLDRGVTEIHHHIGAGMDFPLMWASLLSALGAPGLRSDAVQGPGLPSRDGEELLRWLLAAAVARCVLAEFLLRSDDALLPDFVWSLKRSRGWLPGRHRVLRQALEALARGRLALLPDFTALHGLYQDLHPTAARNSFEPPETLDEVWRRCDPLAVRLHLSKPNAGERWLVSHALERLEWLEAEAAKKEGAVKDELFSHLFWQVVRARCLTYRAYVQRPMTAGLQWFIRFYDRVHVARGPLSAARAEVSYHVAGGGQPIAALEVRITPASNSMTLAQDLWWLTRSWRHVLEQTGSSLGSGSTPEFGVVLHLNKSRDPRRQWARGAPPAYGMGTYAEPHPKSQEYEQVRLGGRFAEYFDKQSLMAQATADLLAAVPRMLWLVRGLDVAADELSVPTWVVVPLFRYVRQAAARAAASSASRNAPPLRMTAHVGEDYRHLMEGLRRIFECVYYQLDRSGGRLGHATALGVEPRIWAESVGAVMMPAEDRLWDLVFEWRLYSNHRLPVALSVQPPSGRPPQVENKLRELSELVFGRCYLPHQLAEAHHVLHQLWCPPLSRGEGGVGLDAFTRAFERLDWLQVQGHRQVRRLLHAYRDDEAVFQRGQRLVDIALDDSEVAALQTVQDGLRRLVGARGIVVEVNPSSNLLIGDLLDLRNHPILRLFPPQAQEGAPPPVPIALGADDPIVFSTFLLREYSLLHEAATGAGYSERVVQEWLTAIRQTSMDARFTVPWRPTALGMADELLHELEHYLRKPFIEYD